MCNISATAAFLQSRQPGANPHETVTVAESLHKLAKRLRDGKEWTPPDLSSYGVGVYECNAGSGPMLALTALDGAEPVAWGTVLPGAWTI